jgi:hypothetical protein
MTMCDSNNLVLHLTRIPNMMLPTGRLKSVPKRSILFKVKLNMTHNRFLIKSNNFFMWTVHTFPTPPGPLVDLHNKMVDVIVHMTMMVTAHFSMIKMDADTMTTIAAMIFNFNMIAKGH